MNIIKTTITLLSIVLLSASSLYAKVKIPFGEREVITKVADLPDTPDFLIEDGHYLDLATLHSEFNIAYFLPLWTTKDAKLVGYDAIDEVYYDIPDDKLNELLKSQNLDRSKLETVPFYNKYGGKAIAGILILLIIYGMFSSKKEKVESQEV